MATFQTTDDLKAALRTSQVVDTHYHVGPELVVRRYDVKSLADVAAPFGATLVLKNHTYPTTPLAALARARFGASFFGGVVLNRFVGGLNPMAVESAVSGNRAKVDDPATDTSPIVVWMPTVHAVSHIATHGFGFDPNWSGCCSHGHDPEPADAQTTTTPEEPVIVFNEDGSPLPALIETLEAIARNSCILATGHLSAGEVMRLVPLALEIGVPKIILTHPHYPSILLQDADLKTLVKDDRVYIEHCFAIHTQDGVPLEAYARSIRATGPDQVLLSTDFGQVNSDPFPEGTIRYAAELNALLGDFLSPQQFIAMFSGNGRRVLGQMPV